MPPQNQSAPGCLTLLEHAPQPGYQVVPLRGLSCIEQQILARLPGTGVGCAGQPQLAIRDQGVSSAASNVAGHQSRLWTKAGRQVVQQTIHREAVLFHSIVILVGAKERGPQDLEIGMRRGVKPNQQIIIPGIIGARDGQIVTGHLVIRLAAKLGKARPR